MIFTPAATTARMLQVSLTANLLLAGGFCLLWLHDRESPEAVLASQPVEPAQKTQMRPASVPVSAPAFHWRELDAADFATFVANLRKIGCPEPTIRDIVDGELREIYATQAKDGAFTPVTPAGSGSASTLGAPSNQPRSEEQRQRVLASLLSPDLVENPGTLHAATAPTATVTQNEPVVSAMTQAEQIPAAFQVGDDPSTTPSPQELSTVVSDASLDAETAMQLTRMRQDFAAEVSPDSNAPDPGSPEYFRQWMKAKRESDDRFSSMYGGDALNALYRQSMAKAGDAAAGK
jgi:hypothetical protein